MVANLPKHLYVWVDADLVFKPPKKVTRPQVLVPAVWFGLNSVPGRAWGCTVMLECGAVYRNLPPNSIAFTPKAQRGWKLERAQRWNCYGHRFQTIEYEYLAGLTVKVMAGSETIEGKYLFTAVPLDDPYSAAPDQSKEFMFVQLANGRMTAQPTDRVLFYDESFTTNSTLEFPTNIRRQTEIHRAES